MESQRGGHGQPRAGTAARNDVCWPLRRQPLDGLLLSCIQSAQPPARSVCRRRALAGIRHHLFQETQIGRRSLSMGARQQGDDACRRRHGRDHTHRRCRGSVDRRVSHLALALGRNRPRLQSGGDRAHRHDGPRDVPLHPAGLTRRAGDGHAQCTQCLRHAGAVVVFFQPRFDDRWRGDRLVDGSDMGETKPRWIFNRRGHWRHGAVGLSVSRAAPCGLPLRRRLPLE